MMPQRQLFDIQMELHFCWMDTSQSKDIVAFRNALQRYKVMHSERSRLWSLIKELWEDRVILFSFLRRVLPKDAFNLANGSKPYPGNSAQLKIFQDLVILGSLEHLGRPKFLGKYLEPSISSLTIDKMIPQWQKIFKLLEDCLPLQLKLHDVVIDLNISSNLLIG